MPVSLINLEPRLETLPQKHLVGMCVQTHLMENKIPFLWQSFMPRRNEIHNRIGQDLYSIQVFEPGFNYLNFMPQTVHQRWATAEVSNFDNVPEGMETLTLEGGLYAVFTYKGRPTSFPDTWKYIYFEWLPKSGYTLAEKPHFEILGSLYINNHDDSIEDIYVPIKPI